jgi:hypothetical protein
METRAPLHEKYLPVFDAREYHEIELAASTAQAYDALRSLDLSCSCVVRVIFGIRTLPSLFLGQPWGSPAGPFVEHALAMGWAVLEEVPGHAFIAGAVTQPWAPVVQFRGLPAAEFLAFSDPGFVKIAWGFAVEEVEDAKTRVTTETRASATDEISRRKFRRYWFVVSPGIRLIRSLALRLLRQQVRRLRDAA